MSGSKLSQWLEAVNAKMQSMRDNEVQDLVDLPHGNKIIGCKWVFKNTDMDGNVNTFKARLVAKGYTQTQGVYYSETYSPVVSTLAIRILVVVDKYLSDAQRPTDFKEKIRMVKIPYAFVIGSIMYLRRTKDMFLVYGALEDELNVKAVAWRSSKQYSIEMSSTKSEYINVSKAVKLAYWIKKFIDELGVVPSIENPVKVYCDNSGTILLASECITQKGSIHILCMHHYICKANSLQNVDVIKVHNYDNIVDPLTKALPCDKHEFHANGMGLRYVGIESS
ncbi:putative retrotransposon protein [Tanacetum coccineum]